MAEEHAIEVEVEVVRAQRRAVIALLAFVVLVTAKFAVLRVTALSGGSLVGLVVDAAFVLGVLAAVDLFFADMRYRALIVADVVFSALLGATALYASYYHLLPTKTSLAALGQAATVGGSILELLSPLQLLMFADLPFLIWWGWRARKRGVDAVTGQRSGMPPAPRMRTPYVYQRRRVYVIATVALVVFGMVVNSVRSSGSQIDGYAASRKHGFSAYIAADLLGMKKTVAAADFDDKSLQVTIDELKGGPQGAPLAGFEPGSAVGSNVIVIQVEALQAAAVGLKVGDQEVTPNLNRLIERSWYFPNHVTTIGRGTTSDAEFVTNTSLYPPLDGAASLVYSDHEFPSAPRLLAASGYNTMTFHTNSVKFWNRSQLYPAIGFGRYFDDKYFGSEDKIAFASSDRVLFDKTLEELARQDSQGKRFYSQIVTMSSHFPFTEVPNKERKLRFTSEYAGTIEGDYLVEIEYADRQIGAFIERLEETGLLDRSIVVIYGDHFGLPYPPRNEKEKRAVEFLLGHEYTPVDKLNTPLIIRLPGQTEARLVDTPVGQIDLMPSVADALGVDLKDLPHFGRSAFREGGVLTSGGGLLPVGSYVDENVLYIAGDTFATGEVWDVRTRRRVDVSAASEEKYSNMLKLLEASDAYVQQLPVRADYDPDSAPILPSE